MHGEDSLAQATNDREIQPSWRPWSGRAATRPRQSMAREKALRAGALLLHSRMFANVCMLCMRHGPSASRRSSFSTTSCKGHFRQVCPQSWCRYFSCLQAWRSASKSHSHSQLDSRTFCLVFANSRCLQAHSSAVTKWIQRCDERDVMTA